jgi:hypothetical protein
MTTLPTTNSPALNTGVSVLSFVTVASPSSKIVDRVAVFATFSPEPVTAGGEGEATVESGWVTVVRVRHHGRHQSEEMAIEPVSEVGVLPHFRPQVTRAVSHSRDRMRQLKADAASARGQLYRDHNHEMHSVNGNTTGRQGRMAICPCRDLIVSAPDWISLKNKPKIPVCPICCVILEPSMKHDAGLDLRVLKYCQSVLIGGKLVPAVAVGPDVVLSPPEVSPIAATLLGGVAPSKEVPIDSTPVSKASAVVLDVVDPGAASSSAVQRNSLLVAPAIPPVPGLVQAAAPGSQPIPAEPIMQMPVPALDAEAVAVEAVPAAVVIPILDGERPSDNQIRGFLDASVPEGYTDVQATEFVLRNNDDRMVSWRNVQRAPGNYMVVSITCRRDMTLVRQIRRVLRFFVYADILLSLVSVCLFAVPRWAALFSIVAFGLSVLTVALKVYVTFAAERHYAWYIMPHLLSELLLNYSRGTNIDVIRSTIRQNALRNAALPLSDLGCVRIVTDTELFAVFVLSTGHLNLVDGALTLGREVRQSLTRTIQPERHTRLELALARLLFPRRFQLWLVQDQQ